MYKKILFIILLFTPLATIFAANSFCHQSSDFTPKLWGYGYYRWALRNDVNNEGWAIMRIGWDSRISLNSIFSPDTKLIVYFFEDKVFCDYGDDHGMRLINYKKPNLNRLSSLTEINRRFGDTSRICHTTAGNPQVCFWEWM